MMPRNSAAIVGGVAAALASVGIIIGFIWFCKTHCKNFSNRNNSESASSGPSAIEMMSRGAIAGGLSQGQQQGAREFTIEELEQATKSFSDNNLIGYGSFGPVYKGLLRDTIVAIKTRPGSPRPEFVAEVGYLSEIRHRHLVSLLGYCQANGYQMLVYEYLTNGSMCNHLYDTGAESATKLEFKQRLSIALGAARGLSHLHGLNPPLTHNNFKTANVLVDENFNPKVADAGISRLLQRIEEAGPSRVINVFRDPELGAFSENFTESSDVYSFGVFLLELVTGQEASKNSSALGSNESFIQWVASSLSSNTFVDGRLEGSFTMEGMRDLLKLMLQCLRFPGTRRPKINAVVTEIERIHENERTLTTVMGEGTATITLGSELFTSKT